MRRLAFTALLAFTELLAIACGSPQNDELFGSNSDYGPSAKTGSPIAMSAGGDQGGSGNTSSLPELKGVGGSEESVTGITGSSGSPGTVDDAGASGGSGPGWLVPAHGSTSAGGMALGGQSGVAGSGSGGEPAGGAPGGSGGIPEAGTGGSSGAGDSYLPASCKDGAPNGAETDVDCGGAECNPCATGERCNISADCDGTLECDAGYCYEPAPEPEPEPQLACRLGFVTCDGECKSIGTGTGCAATSCTPCRYIVGYNTRCENGACYYSM